MHEGEILRFDQNYKSGGVSEEREDSEIPRLRFAALGMIGGGRGGRRATTRVAPTEENIVGHGDHPHPNLPPQGGRDKRWRGMGPRIRHFGQREGGKPGVGWETGSKGRPYGGNIVGHGDHPHPNLPPSRGKGKRWRGNGDGSPIREDNGRGEMPGVGWEGKDGSRTAPTGGRMLPARGSPPSPVFTREGSNLPPSRGKGFVGVWWGARL